MADEMTKVVIPRSKWTGRDGYIGTSGCSPHHRDGSQCCLGHVMNAFLGDKWWPTSDTGYLPMFISMPQMNSGQYLPKLPAWMGSGSSPHQSSEVDWLANVNDSPHYRGGQAMKEANIAYVLGEYGIDVEFID